MVLKLQLRTLCWYTKGSYNPRMDTLSELLRGYNKVKLLFLQFFQGFTAEFENVDNFARVADIV